jgi:hypothetical protein
MRHGIVPPNYSLAYDWLPAAAAIAGGVADALVAVLAAGRRAARVPPTLALTDAAAEPRLLDDLCQGMRCGYEARASMIVL